MSRVIDHSTKITSLYSVMIEELYKERQKFSINQTLNNAINLSIVLHTACLTESELENKLLIVLKHYREKYNANVISDYYLRKEMNGYYKRIENYFDSNIRKTTGVERYDYMFQILLGKGFSSDEHIKSQLEGIKVLFQFRNQIAHGREIHVIEESVLGDLESFTETFIGGYKKVENYLIKKKIIDSRFIENNNLDLFFSNAIADHFYVVSKLFLEKVDEFIQSCFNDSQIDILQDITNKYNQCSGKHYTVEELIKNEDMEIRRTDTNEVIFKMNKGVIEINKLDEEVEK